MTQDPTSIDPELWLRDYQRTADELAARAREAEQNMRAIHSEIETKHVVLSVNAAGVLESLRVRDAGMALSAARLSEAIMNAHAEAVTQATAQMRTIVAGISPLDGEQPIVDYMQRSVPADVQRRMDQINEERRR
ncbi:hypothetical protein ACQB6R_02290 [Propionibacteriaceae bacterium G1746]|uniref:hypothetical protein n=1 Tax=Aestuariimicrobium sp. G57 TaxID=3418485 RepID=UPI003C2A710F